MPALSPNGLTIQRLARQTLNEHADVTITSPANGHVLQWNGSAWVNAVAPGASNALNDLTDVVITSATAGDMLRFDGANWINTKTLTHTITSTAQDALIVSRAVGQWATVFLRGNGEALGLLLQSSTDGTALLWNYANAGLTLATNNVERLRIAAAGGLVVTQPAGQVGLQIAQPSGSLASAISVSGGTDTGGANPLMSLAQTWNAVGVAFTALLVSITNTASLSTSKLLDLKVGGGSAFSVDRAGNWSSNGGGTITQAGLTISAGGLNVDGDIVLNDPTNDGIWSVQGTAGAVGYGFTNRTTGLYGSGIAVSVSISSTQTVEVSAAQLKVFGNVVLDGARVLNFEDADAVIQRAGTTKLTLASGSATFSDSVTVASSSPVLIVKDTANLESAAAFVSYVSGRDSANTEVWYVGDGSPTGKNVTLSAKSGYGLQFSANGVVRLEIPISGRVMFTPGANAEAIAVIGYSLTGSNAQSLLDLDGTWNTSGNPTAILLNITNTASGAASKLLDLRLSGVAKFTVDKNGALTLAGALTANGSLTVAGASVFNGTVTLNQQTVFAAGSAAAPGLYISGTLSGLFNSGGEMLGFAVNGQRQMEVLDDGIVVIGESASLARLRFRGFYTASPSDPPTDQCDLVIIDNGTTVVARFRYNDAGTVKVIDVGPMV